MRIQSGAAVLALALAAPTAGAQPPQAGPDGIVIANPNATFPAQQRALPPADVIERGEGLYQVNCRACHGADLRGGDQGGPNLLRSEIVLNDIAGELIGQIVMQGRNRMPPIPSLTGDAIEAVAGYVHSVVATSQGQGAPPRVEYDLDILVGDAPSGEAYFERQCTSCHSATGDLGGIASRITDPVDLQNAWVAGRARRPFGAPAAESSRGRTTVTVIEADGERISGELLRYDDFFVSLRTDDGAYRSFSRRGDSPGVVIDDPLWRHRELLDELTDDTMYDVTAYLETLE